MSKGSTSGSSSSSSAALIDSAGAIQRSSSGGAAAPAIPSPAGADSSSAADSVDVLRRQLDQLSASIIAACPDGDDSSDSGLGEKYFTQVHAVAITCGYCFCLNSRAMCCAGRRELGFALFSLHRTRYHGGR
jgi:hypothetical protein